VIRPATLDDLPAILALERSCSTAAHWGETEYRLAFRPGATPRILLVAEGVAVVGFIVVRTIGPEWELENVAVAPAARGRGVGLELVRAITKQAEARHVESILLEVRASNAAARALYLRAGFSETGCRRAYYTNPDEDAILYRLHLSASSSSAP
jgi:[ribosomal protein S18]-alanine N-acetyltransferase